MTNSILPLRIYYEDTDFSGFVYHARYLHFFERGRTEALRALGIDQRAMHEAEGGPFGFVVRRMSIEYHQPARMDDLVVVETQITALGAASIAMHQRLMRDGNCLSEAKVEIAYLGSGRARRMPQEMRAKLELLLLEKTKD
jgi:acyl-CoA thioester hydrolase